MDRSYLQFRCPPLPCYITGGEATYYPGDQHPARTHLGVFDLLFVTKGALYIGEEEFQWKVSANCVLILKPNCRQYPIKKCEEETHFFWLHFTVFGEWSERFVEQWTSYPGHIMYFDQFEDDLLNLKASHLLLKQFSILVFPSTFLRLCRELLELETCPREEDRVRQQLILQQLLLDLQSNALNNETSAKRTIAERAAAFIRINFRKPLTHSMLQQSLHFNPSYISRCMKDVYGTTFNQYLVRFRIEQAALLLLTTDDTIQNIAAQVGFHNLSYFARQFVREKKVTPGLFRKNSQVTGRNG